MFQSFAAVSDSHLGPARLARLRAELAREGLAGVLVPRADIHQGEYVAPRDARLQWLTGFSGSAGFALVTERGAAIFVDGRYRVQVRHEVAPCFTPVDWPATGAAQWLAAQAAAGALPPEGRIGYDPWLHTHEEITALAAALPAGITLAPAPNLVDRIWPDRPAAPAAPARVHPEWLAGRGAAEKCADLGAALAPARAAVLTLPDSICWLLNIRGADIPRNPLVQCLAILHADGTVDLFGAAQSFASLGHALGPGVRIHPREGFEAAVAGLAGPVRLDPATAPLGVAHLLEAAGTAILWAPDPCRLPKATKTQAELGGMEAAHLRDGAAMIEFLAWLETELPRGGLTEIDVVRKLETCRRATGRLLDISFDTICGAGPNGAIVHYRVTEGSNRAVRSGELLLVDSGGQYEDGTTDITRTLCYGTVPDEARKPYTLVLSGLIALSSARFPRGVAGAHLDALARAPLWREGMDYDHGTGHGVGAALCVHEGPARISRLSSVPLAPGMIFSNEPGYYREGAFGIRIENLMQVVALPPGPDGREMLGFETLTLCPIDLRPIDRALLSPAELAWINAYHARVRRTLSGMVGPAAREWLAGACAPI